MKKSLIIFIVSAVVVTATIVGVVLIKNDKDPSNSSSNAIENTSEATESLNTVKEKVSETSNTVKKDNKSSTTSDEQSSTSDRLQVTEIDEIYDADLPLGLELNYLTVNGNDIVIRVETLGNSKQQSKGPYYIYYRVTVGNDTLKLKTVREGIYHLEGFGIEMLKTFDMEEDAGTNYEFFEWDFTSSVHKGKDKEYVAFSIPAGIKDKNQASLIITTEDGKLLGEFIADVIHDIKLTGPEVDKYTNHSGDVVFNSIKDGKITYLTPTAAMYKTDSNGKKSLDSSLDVLELEEHSITMNNNKATDKKTDNIYKITNAKGKKFAFTKFKHL